jgi:hypothetical protein
MALNTLGNGSYNVALGYGSFPSLLTDHFNVAVGNAAGNALTGGSYNTFIGQGAARSSSGSSNYLTVIGAGAVGSASNSIVLGRAADTVYIPGQLDMDDAPIINVPTPQASGDAANMGYVDNAIEAAISGITPSGDYEASLGDPTNDNDVLVSTTAGVRSWVNNMSLHNPRLYWEVGPEDFFNPTFLTTSQLKDWVYWGYGTNGYDISGEGGQYGGYYMHVNCASTTNISSIHVASQALRWGKGDLNFVSRFKLRQVSTSSQQFRARTGIGWNWPDHDNRGCYFRYREDENGGHWSAVIDNGSTDTYCLDTGVAGDTAWHVFQIEVNANATLATFYIDYVQVAQVDPHIGFPADSRTDAWALLLVGRGTGTNTVSADIDYAWVWGKKDLTYAP